MKQGIIQRHSRVNEVRFRKLDVCESFGMTREFVAEDGDAVDGAAGLKVGLDIFGRRTIINVSNENAPAVDQCLFIFCFHWEPSLAFRLFKTAGALCGCLQLSQLFGLAFHLFDALFHEENFLGFVFLIVTNHGFGNG